MAAGPIPPEVLIRIPGCEQGRQPLAVHRLPGGRGVNEVLRVDTAQGRFVWRRRRLPLNRPGAAAMLEVRAQQLAAAAGIAPTLLAVDPAGSWLLMEFIDAPLWTEQQLHSSRGLETLGRRLAQLHALPVPPELASTDAAQIARGYLAQLQARGAAAASGAAPMVARVEALASELRAAAPRRTLAHGDLVVANMLGGLPLLIDWEYAQVTDPTWDVACLLAYYPTLAPLAARLQAASSLDGPDALRRLGLQQGIFALLNRLWTMVEAS